jgi:hypothetical protein
VPTAREKKEEDEFGGKKSLVFLCRQQSVARHDNGQGTTQLRHKECIRNGDKLGHRLAREAVADEQRRQQTTRCEKFQHPKLFLISKRGSHSHLPLRRNWSDGDFAIAMARKAGYLTKEREKGKRAWRTKRADGRREDDFQPFRNAAEAPRWPAAKEGG